MPQVNLNITTLQCTELKMDTHFDLKLAYTIKYTISVFFVVNYIKTIKTIFC